MTRISTIGAAAEPIQAELNKLIDYQQLIYQRLLVLAKLRQRIKAKYPQAILPFDTIFRSYVNAYNTRNAEIQAKAKDVKLGGQTTFAPLAAEFGPGSAGIGEPISLTVIIVVAVIAAVAAGTAYTITEVQRQNKAAATEIEGLDKMLTTFKSLPGADANSLGSFLSKVDYSPGNTPPPSTGITATLNTVVVGAAAVAALYFGAQMFSSYKKAA